MTSGLHWVAGAASLLLVGGLAPSALAQSSRLGGDASTIQYQDRAVAHAKAERGHGHRPPRAGRFIYGHWTPYSPPDPASLPADARRHVVVGGDTLWDLSKQYYGEPLLWPSLWDANSWVRDPHWIYPGDTLLVPPLMVLPSGTVATKFELPPLSDGFYPAGLEGDMTCGHLIAPRGREYAGQIIDTPVDPPPVVLTLGELVNVDVGSKDGVLPGDEFAVVYPRHHFAASAAELRSDRTILKHPVSGQRLGDVIKMVGRLRIVLLGESVSTALIVGACDSIEMGYSIHPFVEMAVPLARRAEREALVNAVPERGRGYVIYLSDETLAISQGQLVSLDLGAQHGVVPGDAFTVYRDAPYDFLHQEVEHLGDWYDTKMALRKNKRRTEGSELGTYLRTRRPPETPPRLIAEVVVLYTEEATATAKVTRANVEIMVGDKVVYAPVGSGASDMATWQVPGEGDLEASASAH